MDDQPELPPGPTATVVNTESRDHHHEISKDDSPNSELRLRAKPSIDKIVDCYPMVLLEFQDETMSSSPAKQRNHSN